MAQLSICAKIIIVPQQCPAAGILIYGPKLCVPSDNYFALIKPDCRRANGDFFRNAQREKQNCESQKSSWESAACTYARRESSAQLFFSGLCLKNQSLKCGVLGSVDFMVFKNDAALLGWMMDCCFRWPMPAVWKLKIIAFVQNQCGTCFVKLTSCRQ